MSLAALGGEELKVRLDLGGEGRRRRRRSVCVGIRTWDYVEEMLEDTRPEHTSRACDDVFHHLGIYPYVDLRAGQGGWVGLSRFRF